MYLPISSSFSLLLSKFMGFACLIVMKLVCKKAQYQSIQLYFRLFWWEEQFDLFTHNSNPKGY